MAWRGFLLFYGFGLAWEISFVYFLKVIAQSDDVLVELTRVYHPFVVLPIDVFPVVRKILLTQLAVVVVGGLVLWSLW